MRNPATIPTPGFNLFSKEQDIQLGRAAAQRVRQQYETVGDRRLQEYVARVGNRLSSRSLAQGFPYSFTLLNSKDINAFALPGGPIFVFDRLLLFADNEAEFAGVLAHEISHVVLRHATNQMSKSDLLQIPAVLVGATVAGDTLGQIVERGLGVGLNGLFLHYSRDDESQADALGARIMASAGYDPIELARFFQKLEERGGPGVPQFLSDHPNPGDRVMAVEEVIRTMPPRKYDYSTGRFESARRRIRSFAAGRR